MAKAKTTAAAEKLIQALNEQTCTTSSGKSTLAYQIGADDTGTIHLKVSGNHGGVFFSNEWVALADIQAALNAWSEDQGITSMTFRKIFRGKSANTPGFLIAVLVATGLLEPMEGKSRGHQACDPSARATRWCNACTGMVSAHQESTACSLKVQKIASRVL